MNADAANAVLLAAYRAGDQSAAAVLFNRYLVRLTALVRSRLSRRLSRRADPDDIVLSAFRSFFVAAADGRIAVPANDDLWPLLVVLVLRKLSRTAGRHTALQRDVTQEAVLNSAILNEAIAGEPTPEQAASLEDELGHLLNELPRRERDIVVLRLRGESEHAIARMLDCSERTIRRGLERVRQLIVDRGGIGAVAWPRVPSSPHPQTDSAASVTPSAIGGEPPWVSIPYGDLKLEQLIGSGGMAKLYRATWRPAHTSVAVKFLRKRFWSNRHAVAGLLTEAHTLRHLQHPQIVALLGAGRTPQGGPFLVLPWIDGDDLAAWRVRARPALAEIVDVMQSVLDPIAAAHAAGIVHCDLKPANLLIDHAARVYLTDFGFARSIRPDSSHPTRGGTVAFCAPEQLSDAFGDVDARTDIYSWGATLYCMLCGRPPHVADDIPALIAEIVSARDPEPPSHWNSSVLPWLDAVVLKCLAKEPGGRFATVLQLARHVRDCASRHC